MTTGILSGIQILAFIGVVFVAAWLIASIGRGR